MLKTFAAAALAFSLAGGPAVFIPDPAAQAANSNPWTPEHIQMAHEAAECARRHIIEYSFEHPEQNIPLPEDNYAFANQVSHFLYGGGWHVQDACAMAFQSYIGALRAINGR